MSLCVRVCVRASAHAGACVCVESAVCVHRLLAPTGLLLTDLQLGILAWWGIADGGVVHQCSENQFYCLAKPYPLLG